MKYFYYIILITILFHSCIDKNKENYLKICQPATNLTPQDIIKIGFDKIPGSDAKIYGYQRDSMAVSFTISDDFDRIIGQRWHIFFDTLTEDRIRIFLYENDLLIRGKQTQPTVVINKEWPRILENCYIIEHNKELFISEINTKLNMITIIYKFPTKT